MFLKSTLPKIVLGLLGLVLLVSTSEAAGCNAGSTKAKAACSSQREIASGSPDSLGETGAPSTPTGHAGGKSSCAPCFFCLSPGINSSPVTVSLEDPALRVALPEYATDYEAPTLTLLRPPRS